MSDRLPADALPELADVVVEGLTTLDEGPVRPPYFNDRALEQAKALANLATAELPLVVANGEAKVDATKRLMTHVDEVIGIPRESIGTIEGKLETLDIHSRPQRFAIFDLLTDRRVECYFGTRVELDEVLRGVGRRVAVTGVIKTRPSGERLAIEARELRIFPAEDELPTPDDVRGILRLPESA